MKVKKIGKGKPVIGIVGCLHGNEYYGKAVLDKTKSLNVIRGTILTVLSNQKACIRKQRFVDQDLNRSFPGDKNGNYEQRLAVKLKRILSKCDFVIDLHSSSTTTEPFIILSKLTKNHLKFLPYIPIEKVIYMSKSVANGKSLIDYCKCGVSLEMGKHTKPELSKYAYKVIVGTLANLGIVRRAKEFKVKPKELFVVYSAAFHGERDRIKPRNFIKTSREGKSFYPILVTPKKFAYDNVHYLISRKEPYEKLRLYRTEI